MERTRDQESKAPVLSKTLKKDGNYGKNGRKGYDTMITRLQKQCYVVISDFKYSTDKSGNQYGWGIAEYSTPEESYQRVLKQFKKILPYTGNEEIERILR